MGRGTTAGLVSLLLAVAAVAQPSVTVLPQPSLGPAEGTTLEITGGADPLQIEVPLREQILELPVAGSPPWKLRCADPAFWCPDLLLVDEPGDPRPFPIFRRASLVGSVPRRVAGEPVEGIVIQGWVEYRAGEDPLLVVLDLAVEDGTFRAEIPHAPLDLRIAIPGAAPLYRWGVQPDEDGTLDLGELAPVRGGSLSGFLTTPGAGTTAGATVELEPLAAAVPPQVSQRLGRMEYRTTADGSGFFQLTGMVPGRYRLLARQGELRAGPEIVEIDADEELHLRRLPLRGPHTLRVRLVPPAPSEEERWIVVFYGAETETREEAASGAGEVTLDGLAAGTYTLAVLTPRRDRLLERQVAVHGDQTLELRTDRIPMRGEVRLGGDPLLARLIVETGDGDATQLETDRHGILSGWVPRPKRPFLRVRVQAAHLDVDRTLELVGDEVEIEDGVLHLDLDLSQARVTGTVVDELGRPVAEATVQAWNGWLPAAETVSDLEGGFRLDGLDVGSYWVTVRHPGRGAAEPVQVRLPESDSTAEVVLGLRPLQPVRGSLLAADGSPVSGARLSITSVGFPFNDFVATGADGTFEASVVAGTSLVSTVVLAPSRFLWATCQGLPGDELVVSLPAGPSGNLRLVMEWDETLPPVAGSLFLASESGGVVSGDVRGLWSGGGVTTRKLVPGREVEEIRGLAPGHWSAFFADEPGWMLTRDRCLALPDPNLRGVDVLPAAEAVLELDAEPQQRLRIDPE